MTMQGIPRCRRRIVTDLDASLLTGAGIEHDKSQSARPPSGVDFVHDGFLFAIAGHLLAQQGQLLPSLTLPA